MIDSYFITRIPNSREFQLSALLDGLTWDVLDVGIAEGAPDNLVSIVADHRELWCFGSQHSEIFVNTGAALFPFERLNQAYVEQGCAATLTACQLDTTIFWLGRNQHGTARVFKNQNYSGLGVSDRATEWWFNEYAKRGAIEDAKAYGYQDENGHSFYVITFPSATCEPAAKGGMVDNVVAGATWVYDVTENMWHERQSMNPKNAKMGKTLGTFHTFAFGKHIVGGGDDTGNLYEMSVDYYRDDTTRIKRIRRAPHLVDELKTIVYQEFQLSCQTGTAATGDSDTRMVLRVSNDGGATWSNEYSRLLGTTGDNSAILSWKALGKARRRSFEVSTTIDGQVCIVDAFLKIVEGR